jgi:hypothetical protein
MKVMKSLAALVHVCMYTSYVHNSVSKGKDKHYEHRDIGKPWKPVVRILVTGF